MAALRPCQLIVLTAALATALAALSCASRPVDNPSDALHATDLRPPPDTLSLPPSNANGWVSTFGPNVTKICAAKLDGIGNIYVYGQFRNETTIAQQKLVAVTSAGSLPDDPFLAKVAANGVVQWGIAFGATRSAANPWGWESPGGMALDAQGNIYITGTYVTQNYPSTAHLGGRAVTTAGKEDVFLARLTPQGTVDWLVSGGSPETDRAADVAVSPSGIVLVTGWIGSAAKFGSLTVQALEKNTGCLVAYESATGKALWAHAAGEVPVYERAWSVIARDGGFHVAGRFRKQVTLDGQTVQAKGGFGGLYLASLTDGGKLHWIGEALSTKLDSNIEVWDMDTDGAGGIYLTGMVEGHAIVAGELQPDDVNPLHDHGYLMKTSPTGAVEWSLYIEPEGRPGVAVQGLKSGGVDWIGLLGSYVKLGDRTLTSRQLASLDAFVARVGPSGNVQSLTSVIEAGALNSAAMGCAADGCRIVGTCGPGQSSLDTITALGMQVPLDGRVCVVNRYADGQGH